MERHDRSDRRRCRRKQQRASSAEAEADDSDPGEGRDRRAFEHRSHAAHDDEVDAVAREDLKYGKPLRRGRCVIPESMPLPREVQPGAIEQADAVDVQLGGVAGRRCEHIALDP